MLDLDLEVDNAMSTNKQDHDKYPAYISESSKNIRKKVKRNNLCIIMAG